MVVHSERLTTREELLFCAALLAGLGPQARSITKELCVAASDSLSTGRTCIDAGSTLMFSLISPGRRSLRILSRSSDTGIEQSISRWLRMHYCTGKSPQRWIIEAFSGERAEAWQHALNLARTIGGETALRRRHAALGPLGRIFNISYELEKEAPCGWVTWQLDRHISPSKALVACGIEEVWPTVVQCLQRLFGRAFSQEIGPWSIAWTLDENNPRMRVGTSMWARILEDTAKRSRLLDTVEHLGGDRPFAEALYKLLESAHPTEYTTRIGRAVEVELSANGVLAIEFYLSVPSTTVQPSMEEKTKGNI
jgi:uncharacterized protein YuzE